MGKMRLEPAVKFRLNTGSAETRILQGRTVLRPTGLMAMVAQAWAAVAENETPLQPQEWALLER